MDKTEQTKEFLNYIFYNLDDDEYIRMCSFKTEKNCNKPIPFIQKLESVDKVMEALDKLKQEKRIYYNDIYFQLQSYNGVNGLASSRKYVYCIGFDIDLADNCFYSKKELHEMKMINDDRYFQEMEQLKQKIFNVLKEINFYTHYIVSSGFGFHIYHLLEKTDNFDKVEEVTHEIYKRICSKGLVVDKKALSKTQILRIINTYNCKISKNKASVNLVVNNVFDTNNNQSKNFYRSNINTLYNTFILNKKKKEEIEIHEEAKELLNTTGTKVISKTEKKNVYLEKIMLEGSPKGKGVRNKDKVNLIVYLKYKRVAYSDIVDIMKKWAKLSNYKITDKDIKDIYNKNYKYIELTEDEIPLYYIGRGEVSDFNYSDDEELIEFETKLYKKGEGIMISGKAIFVYNILYMCKHTSLTIENILECATNNKTKKVALSERDVSKALKELISKDLVVFKKGNSRLKQKDKFKYNSDVDKRKVKTIQVSSLINEFVIRDIINFEELRFYIYLRIIQRKMVEDGKCFGNELKYLNQEKMAENFGVSLSKIKRLFQKLYESGLVKKITKYVDYNKTVNDYILVK